jgi:hypothetical protein
MHGRFKQRCFEEGEAGAHTQSAARMKSYGPPAASTCAPLLLSDAAIVARRLPWLWAAIGCLGLPARSASSRASCAAHHRCHKFERAYRLQCARSELVRRQVVRSALRGHATAPYTRM